MSLLIPPIRTEGSTARMSEEEFLSLGEDVSAEWVNGVTYFMPAVNAIHDDIVAWCLSVMRPLVRRKGLGKVFGEKFVTRISPARLRSPDISFVSASRIGIVEDARLSAAPDFVIEVVSPESTSRDYRDKYAEYEAGGVKEYLIINPLTKAAELHRLRQDGHYSEVLPIDDKLISIVVPGFFFAPGWLRGEMPDELTVLREMGIQQ